MNELTTEKGRSAADIAELSEKVFLRGDLSGLSPEEKVFYVRSLCERLGLDPLTKPFDLIKQGARETLYANSSCTRQLRVKRGMSTQSVTMDLPLEGLLIIRHEMTDRDGNVAVNIGVCHTAGKKGEELENAIKKAWTQAERRVILSLGGLGMADESEASDLIAAAPRRIETPITAPVAEVPTPALPHSPTIPTVEQAIRDEVRGLREGGWLTDADIAGIASEAGVPVTDAGKVLWARATPENWVDFGDRARRLANDRRMDAAEEEGSREESPDEFDLLAPAA